MNRVRRRSLQILLDKLMEVSSELENIKDEEEEYLLNIPENLQSSERYETAETAVDSLDDVISTLEDVVGIIEEVIE